MKTLILYLSIFLGSGLLLTNIYTSMIDAVSWGSSMPGSIETARAYFATVNPGDFFRIFSPINQLLAIVALIAFWRLGKNLRLVLGGALFFYILTDMMTFAYFYPRNETLFVAPLDAAAVARVQSEWATMNWVRSFILGIGVFLSMLSLHKVYTKTVVASPG
jgi:hypothetical protein